MSRYPHPAYGNYYRDPRAVASGEDRRQTAGTYTFGHAGRQIRFGPVALWSIVAALVSMAGWSLGTATYYYLRDIILARMVADQAHMQHAVEQCVAAMRTET